VTWSIPTAVQRKIAARVLNARATEGPPGPYNLAIDDGVKVNRRLFQRTGLLPVREVIDEW
jgi:hypothetical protein